MIYDLSNPLDKVNFQARSAMLIERGGIVELTSKQKRSLKQNAYLHVVLAYFGSQYGESPEYVKEEYFKKLVNPDTFIIRSDTDRLTGKTHDYCRSSADLTAEQMSECIERFRNWSAKEAGIYIPSADDHEMVLRCEMEAAKTNKFV